jgi:hypothetical protein
MENEEFYKSKLVCPKCKCNSLAVTELCVWGSEFTQENGMISNIGHHEPGDYFKVTASCNDCNHRWTVRNAIQIHNVRVK